MKRNLKYKDLSLLLVSLSISQCFDLIVKFCWNQSFSCEDVFRLIVSLLLLILGGYFYSKFYSRLIS